MEVVTVAAFVDWRLAAFISIKLRTDRSSLYLFILYNTNEN